MNLNVFLVLVVIVMFILDFFMTKSYEKTIKKLEEENKKLKKLVPIEIKESKIGE